MKQLFPRIYQIDNDPQAHFDAGQYLIGDSAFVPNNYMVPPYKRARNTAYLPPDRHKFNQAVASARVVVEHTFGMLKMRFQSLRSLRSQIDTQLDLERSLNWIRACVLIHNFLAGDAEDDFWADFNMERLERRWEREAEAVRGLWVTYTDGAGGAPPQGTDLQRQFVKTFAEERRYEPAYMYDSD